MFLSAGIERSNTLDHRPRTDVTPRRSNGSVSIGGPATGGTNVGGDFSDGRDQLRRREIPPGR